MTYGFRETKPISLTALRFRDSPPDVLRRPRYTGPGKPILFGGVPFRPHGPRRDLPELLMSAAPLSCFVHLETAFAVFSSL